jgi:NTE family protein
LAGIRAQLIVDQLDHAFFARSGYYAAATAYAYDESLGSDRNYKRLEGKLNGVMSWRAHTLNITAAGGNDLDTDMPGYDTFTLGGPLRLSGYRIDEFSGRHMAFGRLMYYKRAVHLPDLLGSGVYVGASLEAGRMGGAFQNPASTGTIWSGSVFLGADTFLGPAYFGLGAGEAGRWSLYLLVGVP